MYNPYSHISKQFLTLVEAIDPTSVPISKLEVDTGDLKAPSIRFEPEEIDKMKARLTRDFPSVGDKKLILVSRGRTYVTLKQTRDQDWVIYVIAPHKLRDIARDKPGLDQQQVYKSYVEFYFSKNILITRLKEATSYFSFLINREGKVVRRFSPGTAPDDHKLVEAIEDELAQG